MVGDTKQQDRCCLYLGEAALVDVEIRCAIDSVIAPEQQSLSLEILRPPESSLMDAAAALLQVGMFGGGRCIWLRGYRPAAKRKAGGIEAGPEQAAETANDDSGEFIAFLDKSFPPEGFLFVSTEALDKRSRLFKWFNSKGRVFDRRVEPNKGRLKSEDVFPVVEQRLRANGIEEPPRSVVEEIVRRAGNSIGELLMDVDRLSLAAQKPGAISLAVVRSQMRDQSQAWVFDFTDALSRRDLGAAQTLLAGLLRAGEPPIKLVALVASHLAGLLAAHRYLGYLPRGALSGQAGAFAKGAFKRLPEEFRSRHNPWRAYFLLRGAAAFSHAELISLHVEILQLDSLLKSSPLKAEHCFERFLHRSCTRGRRLAAA